MSKKQKTDLESNQPTPADLYSDQVKTVDLKLNLREIEEQAAERTARLDAIEADLEAALVTHHPQAIRLLIKSVSALVREIR